MLNNEAALDQAAPPPPLPASLSLEDCQAEAQKGGKFSFGAGGSSLTIKKERQGHNSSWAKQAHIYA